MNTVMALGGNYDRGVGRRSLEVGNKAPSKAVVAAEVSVGQVLTKPVRALAFDSSANPYDAMFITLWTMFITLNCRPYPRS